MNPDQLPLRDLHLPDPVGWWPLAPGWWLLFATLVIVTVWLAAVALARHRQGRARRHAARALRQLERRYAEDGDAVQLAIDVSALLRRAMLAYAPRADVAGLTGTAWLKWLDSGLDKPAFADGAGRALVELPYRRPGAEHGTDVEALLRAVRRRLATPLPETRGGS